MSSFILPIYKMMNDLNTQLDVKGDIEIGLDKNLFEMVRDETLVMRKHWPDPRDLTAEEFKFSTPTGKLIFYIKSEKDEKTEV